MAGERIYLKCSAKARQTEYGEFLNLGFQVDELIAFAKQHANERGYLNLTVAARREVGKFGDTHSVSLDTYVKSSGKEAPTTKREQWESAKHSQPLTDSDIPF